MIEKTETGMLQLNIDKMNSTNEELERKIRKLNNSNKEIQNENDMLLSRYVPRFNDPVDEALANFINSYAEKEQMKIMFLRESSGVY